MYGLLLQAFRTVPRIVLGFSLLGVPSTLHASDWLREELPGDISRVENCKRRAVNVAHRLEDNLGLTCSPAIEEVDDDHVGISGIGTDGHDAIIACDFEEDLRTMSVKYVGIVTVKAGEESSDETSSEGKESDESQCDEETDVSLDDIYQSVRTLWGDAAHYD